MMSRRRFAATLGTGPLILGAERKSGSARPVLGEGEHTYEAIHDWGRLPADIRYGNTHGVCEDSQGRIYVHHTVNAASESRDSMVVFDEKGEFVKSWGKEFQGGAHGLHIRREGSGEFLYLCDTKRAVVVKATLDGEVVFTLGYPRVSEPYRDGIKYSPTNLAVAPNSDIYVADGYGSRWRTGPTTGSGNSHWRGNRRDSRGALTCRAISTNATGRWRYQTWVRA